MADPSALLLNLGIQITTRAGPKSIQWFSAKFLWKDIIIVGQPRAGKSSLANYVRFGIFADKDTNRTLDNTKSPPFVVSIGKDRGLIMKVRTVIDTVGQAAAAEHSRLCRQRKPELIVIVLDLVADWRGRNEYAAEFYLNEFFSHFVTAFNRSKRIRNKLRGVLIVLNKRDMVRSGKAKTWISHIRRYVAHAVGPSAADLARNVTVLECSLIEGFAESKLPAIVVQNMAIKLDSQRVVQ